MAKRKLKLESTGTGKSSGGAYISLFFNRELTPIEIEGIIRLVEQGLAR